MNRKLSRQIRQMRRSNRQNARTKDRSVVSALRGIEARRPPLPGARWPSRRLPEAVGWLGSSWQSQESPRRGGLESGGFVLRASTPATLSCNPLLNHPPVLNHFHLFPSGPLAQSERERGWATY